MNAPIKSTFRCYISLYHKPMYIPRPIMKITGNLFADTHTNN